MGNLMKIAIDGPAGAGKSTVAKRVADLLSYVYIDTGAMYRSITLKALRNGVDVTQEDELQSLLQMTKIDLEKKSDCQIVLLDDEDVTEEIRSSIVTRNVSEVAKHVNVRKEMVKRQQEVSREHSVVMDGRDIGTHVIPDAQIKIFLIASVDERAKRRHEENLNKGMASDLEQIKKDIELRDLLDSEREASPLKKADDAIELDTTTMSIEEVVESILTIVREYERV
ncbi:(d)CMP kinase [Pseudalkalibacillus berkeleyi]|uniref:Cytidylate kinase n=1 Tax=Pseudalkalibacillus berkeleyi TaxID=1069813 RepID=A0ABS9H126_9BACL|nr:(d)CMP kinase [Pseudalkalibacillus berkeleyi]MCF6137594.1 (d)CMP kinase [Pseudalkalibacillus berkeleyi]